MSLGDVDPKKSLYIHSGHAFGACHGGSYWNHHQPQNQKKHYKIGSNRNRRINIFQCHQILYINYKINEINPSDDADTDNMFEIEVNEHQHQIRRFKCKGKQIRDK